MIAGFVGQAATFTWTGSAGDGRWRNRTNWDLNAVPGSSDDAIIDVAGSYPNVNHRQFVGTITVNTGATLNVSSGGNMIVNGDVWVNGSLNLTAGGNFRCYILNNAGSVSATGGSIEYNRPQDINKGFDYGNLWVNAPYDLYYDFFIASGDINVYGNLKIGGVTDYLGFYYGTVFSPFSHTIHCQNLQNYGLAYDIVALYYSLPIGTISLENMTGTNNSRVMGISPFLYQSYSFTGTQFEAINLVCQNSATRIDDYLYIDGAIGSPVSTFDFANGNTVLYSGIYSNALDI